MGELGRGAARNLPVAAGVFRFVARSILAPVSPFGPRFERGATIAFKIESETGYREAAESDWCLEPLGSGRGRWRPADLGAVTGKRSRAPETVIAPSRERGSVVVRSEAPLVVLEPGEGAPRLPGRSAEVPFGAVVRAGPVVFAPLTVEQAASLRTGRVTLRVPGETTRSTGPDEAEEEPPKIPRPSLGPHALALTLGFLALLALGAAGWQYGQGRLEPNRVLVALDGWQGPGLRGARDHVTRQLHAAGLDPVVESSGEGLSSGRGLSRDARATRRRAAHLLTISRQEVDHHELVAGLHVVTEQVTVEVVSLDGSPEAGARSAVVTRSGDHLEAAADRARRDALVALLPEAIDDVVLSRTMSRFLARPSAPPDDMDRVLALRRTRQRTWQRRSGGRRLRLHCAEPVGTDGSYGLAGTTRITPPCVDEEAVGLTEDGSSVLVLRQESLPGVDPRTASSLGDLGAHARLDLVDVATRARRTVAYGERIASRPVTSADGSTVVYVEETDRSRAHAVVSAAVHETGRQREVVLSRDGPSRIDFLAVSREGNLVATLESSPDPCKGVRLQVFEDGEPRGGRDFFLAFGVRYVELAWPERQTPRELLAVELPPLDDLYAPRRCPGRAEAVARRGRSPQLVLVDPATGEVVRRLEHDGAHLQALGVGGQGALLLATTGGTEGSGLGGYDPATDQLSTRPLRGNVDLGVALSDGSLLVGSLGGCSATSSLRRVDLAAGRSEWLLPYGAQLRSMVAAGGTPRVAVTAWLGTFSPPLTPRGVLVMDFSSPD